MAYIPKPVDSQREISFIILNEAEYGTDNL
jgi:hypothetical protein